MSARYGNPARGLSVILISGERGKTTTATFLAAILKEAGRRTSVLSGDYDTSTEHFYKSLSKCKKEQTALVLIEATDRLLEIGALQGLSVDTLIVTDENEQAHSFMSLGPKHVVAPIGFSVPDGSVEPYQQITYGDAEDADARIDNIKLYRQGTEVSLTIDHQTKLDVATYYAGYANATDLVAATATAYVLAVPHDSVQEGVADLEPPLGLCSWLQTDHSYEIMYDTASTNKAATLAVKSAKTLVKRRLIVLMEQAYDAETMQYIKEQADRVIVVSSSEHTDATIEVESSSAEAFEKALRGAKRDDAVVVLGSAFASNIAPIANAAEEGEPTA